MTAYEARRGARRARRRHPARTRGVHARGAARRGRCRVSRPPRGRGAQDAEALHGRRIHGRADRRARRRDGSVRTIAVESEDHDRVLATLRELGLRPLPNVSVPRGLKRLLGLGPRRGAVIDVGTNSVKFLLAERAGDGTWRELVDRSEVTRLGEGLAGSGRLGPEPMARTIEAIAAMANEAWLQGADEIVAVGTAGLRDRGQQRRFPRRRRRALRPRARGDRRGGGGAARVPRRDPGPRHGRRARSSSSRPAAGARSSRSASATGSTSGSASRSARCGYTERFGLDDAVDEDRLAEALDGDRGRPAGARRPADARRGGRHGRGRDEPRRREARARDVRPERRPGHGADRSTSSIA